MAARLQGTFYSYNKGPGTGSGSRNTYVVRIDDDDYSGDVGSLELRNIQYEWKGQDEKIFNPILTSACTLTLFVNDTDVENFLLDLVDAPERRMKVYITKNSLRDWVGYIVADLVNIDDRPLEMGYEFKIQAVDGIALLKTIDFNDAGDPYEGKETMLDILYLCLSKIGLDSYYGTGALAAYVYIQCTWFASQHATKANTTNPFEVTRINHRVFRKIDNSGKIVYRKTYDVIIQLMSAFGLRLYYAVGFYWVQEIANYTASGNVRWQAYDKLKAAAAGSNISLSSMNQITDETGDITAWAAGTAPLIVASGGEETFFPALASTTVLYKHYSTQNLVAGIQWSNALVLDQVLEDIDHNSGATRLAFSFSITTRISDSAITDYTPMTPTWLQYNVKISIDAGGGTVYYLRRTATFLAGVVSYGDLEWTTSSVARYQFWLGPQTYDNTQVSTQVALITPPMPASGDVSIGILYNAGATLAGVLGASGTRTITYATSGAYLEAFTDGNLEDQFNYTEYESINSVVASQVDDIDILLGDGPTTNSYGCLEVYNGTVWSKSSGWGRLVDGAYTLPHGQLLSRERLSLQVAPARRLRARIIGNYNPSRLLRRGYDDSTYMLQGARLSIPSEQWEGTWVQIGYSTATVTTNEEQEYISDPNFGVDRDAPPGVLSGNPGRSGLFGILFGDRYDGGVNRMGGATDGANAVSNIFVPYKLTTAISSGASVSSVDVSNADHVGGSTRLVFLYESDAIVIVHPTSGVYQKFSVSTDYVGGTSIAVFSTTSSASFPAGSYVLPDPYNQQRFLNSHWRVRWETVQLFDRTANVAVGTSEKFIMAITEMSGGIVADGGRLVGGYIAWATVGTGTVSVNIKRNGTTITGISGSYASTSYNIIFPYIVLGYYPEFDAGDIITFEVSAITGTAPQGMTIMLGFT